MAAALARDCPLPLASTRTLPGTASSRLPPRRWRRRVVRLARNAGRARHRLRGTSGCNVILVFRFDRLARLLRFVADPRPAARELQPATLGTGRDRAAH